MEIKRQENEKAGKLKGRENIKSNNLPDIIAEIFEE
jgi:hypothetical protein